MPSIGSRAKRERRAGKDFAADLLWFLLPLAAFLGYALTSPGLTRGDAAGVYVTAAALVEDATFAIDGIIGALAPAPAGPDATPADAGPLSYAAGHYYHNVPPGPALIAAPFYALGVVVAPLVGPEAPALLVGLLGPLLGALALMGLARVFRPWIDGTAGWWFAALPVVAAVLPLPWVHAPTAPIVAAVLAVWLVPPVAALWRRNATMSLAGAVSCGLGAFLALDYGAGALAAAVLLCLIARRRRSLAVVTALLAGWLLPVLVLAAHATVAFGQPWRPAFRFAIDPADRALVDAVGPDALLAAVLFVAIAAIGMTGAGLSPGRVPRAQPNNIRAMVARGGPFLAIVLAALVVLWGFAARRGTVILPYDWRTPAGLLPLLGIAVILAGLLAIARYGRVRDWRVAAAPVAILAVAVVLLGTTGGRAVSAAAIAGENNAAPFAIATGERFEPVWTVASGTRFTDPQRLSLEANTRAVSPWVDVMLGEAYRLRLDHAGPLRALFAWEDVTRRPLAQQAAEPASDGTLDVTFAAPVGAAGLRLHLIAGSKAVTVGNPRLSLASGARVEQFPNYHRAALAFSFDWESAMGGLIHSRSAGASEGERVALGADGGPSVAEAEAKALRMREGARFLADQFAQYDIRATYYATGYNLLDGNPACEKFLGDPIYPNADTRNGWASDYWKTHRWYEHDPCATEERAPAWYFASQTRELAAEGHEIASHTFGHLYVRGVKPEQLEADLALWERAARGLGVPVAYSFAFPWTSSNSLDERFFAVFERRGLLTLTRVYPTDLRHPYELDRVKDYPALAIFPDQYLPSTPEAQDAALASIDQVIARRGYHSLWTHPNEALEQGGPVIWPRVIAYAAEARARGLWVAPVTEIAEYGRATRQVGVTALPVAGGTRLVVENRSDDRMVGLTMALPVESSHVTVDGRTWTDVRGGQFRLPPLEPGARVVVTARR